MSRKILHLNSTSRKKQNKAVSREISGEKTTVDPETNSVNSNSEQKNSLSFESQMDQISIYGIIQYDDKLQTSYVQK